MPNTKRSKPILITFFGQPWEVLPKTQYGSVTYKEWCERECDRLGKGHTVESNETGEIAIRRMEEENGKGKRKKILAGDR